MSSFWISHWLFCLFKCYGKGVYIRFTKLLGLYACFTSHTMKRLQEDWKNENSKLQEYLYKNQNFPAGHLLLSLKDMLGFAPTPMWGVKPKVLHPNFPTGCLRKTLMVLLGVWNLIFLFVCFLSWLFHMGLPPAVPHFPEDLLVLKGTLHSFMLSSYFSGLESHQPSQTLWQKPSPKGTQFILRGCSVLENKKSVLGMCVKERESILIYSTSLSL